MNDSDEAHTITANRSKRLELFTVLEYNEDKDKRVKGRKGI